MRLPLRTGPRRRLLEHFINLLERQALHFRYEEVRECHRENAEGAPEEENFGSEVCVSFLGAYEVRGDDSDDLFGVVLVLMRRGGF